MIKISVVKILSVKKAKKSNQGFPNFNTTKIKTWLNIHLRIKEQNNRLPNHVFFYAGRN